MVLTEVAVNSVDIETIEEAGRMMEEGHLLFLLQAAQVTRMLGNTSTNQWTNYRKKAEELQTPEQKAYIQQYVSVDGFEENVARLQWTNSIDFRKPFTPIINLLSDAIGGTGAAARIGGSEYALHEVGLAKTIADTPPRIFGVESLGVDGYRPAEFEDYLGLAVDLVPIPVDNPESWVVIDRYRRDQELVEAVAEMRSTAHL